MKQLTPVATPRFLQFSAQPLRQQRAEFPVQIGLYLPEEYPWRRFCFSFCWTNVAKLAFIPSRNATQQSFPDLRSVWVLPLFASSLALISVLWIHFMDGSTIFLFNFISRCLSIPFSVHRTFLSMGQTKKAFSSTTERWFVSVDRRRQLTVHTARIIWIRASLIFFRRLESYLYSRIHLPRLGGSELDSPNGLSTTGDRLRLFCPVGNLEAVQATPGLT